MGLPVLIYGKSGSGKSRSLKFFDEDEIVLLNTERKELPLRNALRRQDAVMISTGSLQRSTRTRKRLT